MSSIQVAKVGQGFVPANSRPSCRNCINGAVDSSGAQWRAPHNGNAFWRCKLGGFMVNGMDTCGKHELADRFQRTTVTTRGER